MKGNEGRRESGKYALRRSVRMGSGRKWRKRKDGSSDKEKTGSRKRRDGEKKMGGGVQGVNGYLFLCGRSRVSCSEGNTGKMERREELER